MRVAIVITARASYAKYKTTISALLARGVDVRIIAVASAVLERYGDVSKIVEEDFPSVPLSRIWSVLEGENLITSIKETGALASATGDELSRLRPDCVACMADRHEVLAVAQSAAYLHIPLAHIQAGELSGSIDSKVRDAITHLADYYFVCTKLAAMRVYGLTGKHDRIYAVGCGSIDLAQQALHEPHVTAQELGGAGAPIDPLSPFLLVLQHPVTSEADCAYAQMTETLAACAEVSLPRLVLWPGEDAGAGAMSKAIREWIAAHPEQSWHTVRNLPPNRFLRLMTQAACMVGNSSAGIREASYLGVPVVNIGSRQYGRERAANVVDVMHSAPVITAAIEQQIARGRHRPSGLYGDGNAGERIAETLCSIHSGATASASDW